MNFIVFPQGGIVFVRTNKLFIGLIDFAKGKL